jgi:hypothetical protein
MAASSASAAASSASAAAPSASATPPSASVTPSSASTAASAYVESRRDEQAMRCGQSIRRTNTHM